MLTDAELQWMLEQHEHHYEVLPYAFELEFDAERDYVLALDAALPWMVETIRRMEKKLYEAQLELATLKYKEDSDE